MYLDKQNNICNGKPDQIFFRSQSSVYSYKMLQNYNVQMTYSMVMHINITHLKVSLVNISLDAHTPAQNTVCVLADISAQRVNVIRDECYLLFLLLFLFSSSFWAEFRLSASARLSTAMAKNTFSKMSDQMC